MNQPLEQELQELPPRAALAFAPLHKRHFGTAVGSAAALLVAGVTALQLILRPEPGLPLELLGQYFAGYRVSWSGVLIGGLWAFFAGWVGGWFVAFTRNLVLAGMVFWVRARTDLSASREFLDHI